MEEGDDYEAEIEDVIPQLCHVRNCQVDERILLWPSNRVNVTRTTVCIIRMCL